MPKIHPREKIVRSAEKLLRDALSEVGKLELTELEYVQLCQDVLGGEILTICRYGIREERHGNRDTPGGFES
jgi:hypothetical protein